MSVLHQLARRRFAQGSLLCGTLVGVLLLLAPPAVAEGTLSSGGCQLAVSTSPGQPALIISRSDVGKGPVAFQTATPLYIEILGPLDSTWWLAVNYSSAVPVTGGLRCDGEARTPGGTAFDFTDTYSAGAKPDTFVLSRTIAVKSAGQGDAGFATCFSLAAAQPAPLREQQMFVPGLWYVKNQYAPPGALAADPSANVCLIREDRMALPLVMMRNADSGATITLAHLDPDGSTVVADDRHPLVVNAGIHVASLGTWSHENPAVTFCYPASEGTRGRGAGWEQRFHPIQTGAAQSYKLAVSLRVEPDFPTAMRQSWREAYDAAPPAISRADLAAVYAASIGLISDWSRVTNGSPGLPFRLRLPQGELQSPSEFNFQMGFVGQQLPLAYQLLRDGLAHHDETALGKGEAMVDFWAKESPLPDGLPRTWFDTQPQPHWRRYNTFLRGASDGMVGALMAWDVMQANGHPKPQWLAFCRGFGDWLVAHQNADGSWYRQYDFQSQPVDHTEQATSNPIHYLIDLGKATGDKKYYDAALKAGEWCFTNTHQGFAYVGGTPDNPNVMDKEAGFLALDAFLALHDATGDKRWLDAAAQAADFTETWLYSWTIPMPPDDPEITIPKSATSTGFSLIALGHSGSDLFLAAAPFLYYRLYLETGDAHYARIARQCLYNTKEAVDIDGSLGYGHTGLCTEASTFAPLRGHGVGTWLPWLSWAMLDPITRLQDNFQLTDLPVETGTPPANLRAADEKFGRTRGLLTVRQN